KEALKMMGKSSESPEFLTSVRPGSADWNALTASAPGDLDYQTWLGPSQEEPYIKVRTHMNWRWNYNVGGGQLLDWIGHHCDIAHWGMDCDLSGPSEIEGNGEFPPKDAVWNTAGKYRITCKYPNDVTMIIAGGHGDIKGGTKWIGTDGWVWVDRGHYEATEIDWFREIPPDRYKVKLYHSDNHQRNFIECVKSRKPTITPADVAHHSATPGHLGLISMLVGRRIRWDVQNEVIVGDEQASKLLSRPYRSPWKLA
ncbi:MAG TPA: gfo/Idh/MocA family oxidoreductase, partial [Verrucomicrobiae bacterium]|nr:gfo/Idh/MocA family oxidoreductase [Verrucomicrobiae bacterium]